jgi:DnaJ family protein C protein 7
LCHILILFSVKLNKLDQSIEDCNKAIELDEGYIKAYLRRAKSYMDKEEYESAVFDYEKVCKLDKTKGFFFILKHIKSKFRPILY